MKSLLLMVTMFPFVMSRAESQRTVTGTVVDDRGEPLIGASILILGTHSGAVSDIDGKFSIQVPDGSNTLRVSYTGFRSTTVDISTVNEVSVIMATDAIGLEDVIIVGYSSQRKKDITGAVSSVDSDEFATEAALSVENALRGRATGVQVFQASGTPGAAINVRVRGSTSINASNQPLYIIDGVPLIAGSLSQVDTRIGGQTLNALADINPNDIESIEVLKDAASAAVYGNRAANGVVLITTKKGKAGRTELNFDASYGFQEATNLVELGDTAQYRQQMTAIFGVPNALAGGLQGSTNWYDEIFHTGTLQNYQLSTSGGDTRTRFYTSLNYNDNQGIVKKSQFERYSGRLNLDHVETDKRPDSADRRRAGRRWPEYRRSACAAAERRR
jgi:TonB-linked SusC/RagA family outer membrane protein